MKVFIAGGTGLLGYHSVLEFLKRGHEVTTISLPDIKLGTWFPTNVKVKYGDLFKMDNTKLVKILAGQDVLVYALGPDDRVTPVAPAYGFFHEKLVEVPGRIIRAAGAAGVKKCVVLNSYFSSFSRIWPKSRLAERHPYIRCRVEQAERVIAEGNSSTDVMVLELPYIFGTMPERVPLWKDVLVDYLKNSKKIYFPKGGTNMISVEHVAEAIAGAAEKGVHGSRYLIGDENMPWKEMLGIMLKAMGMDKKVITVPTFAATLIGMRIKNRDSKEGKEKGLDPAKLFKDIQSRYLYYDPAESRKELGYGKGGVREAIIKTVKACM
jgi:dihydroflavonol-4-reductase